MVESKRMRFCESRTAAVRRLLIKAGSAQHQVQVAAVMAPASHAAAITPYLDTAQMRLMTQETFRRLCTERNVNKQKRCNLSAIDKSLRLHARHLLWRHPVKFGNSFNVLSAKPSP